MTSRFLRYALILPLLLAAGASAQNPGGRHDPQSPGSPGPGSLVLGGPVAGGLGSNEHGPGSNEHGPGSSGRSSRGGPSAPAKPPGSPTRSPATTPRNGLQIGPTGRWWDNKSTIHAVGINSVQQHRMDQLFDANKPAILATYKTLLAEQARLADLNKSPQPNQAAVFAQIDTVNQARAALQKATTQMLLQIRQEMAPDQIQKLEQIQ